MTLKNVLMTAAGAAASMSLAAAQSPFLEDEGSLVSLTGTVNSVDDDSFEIDYGTGVVEVEFEDAGLFDDPAEVLYPGDRVTVYGMTDDDFLEGRVIEASTVFLTGGSAVYTGDDEISSAYLTPAWEENQQDTTTMTFEGEVTDIKRREFTLTSNGIEYNVDTSDMRYNPLDERGRQKIEEGDRVNVVGELDDNLFDDAEISATMIYSVERTAARNTGMMGGNAGQNQQSAMDDRQRNRQRDRQRMNNRNDEPGYAVDDEMLDEEYEELGQNDPGENDQLGYNEDDQRQGRDQRMTRQQTADNRQMREQDRNRNMNDQDRTRTGAGSNEPPFTETEFAALDLDGNGLVTMSEYVEVTSDLSNVTESEARTLFAALSGQDNTLTRSEFLEPDQGTEDLFERVLRPENNDTY